jgi:2-polyprenyl-3-methyl-5-hydroxy-6-metoxy-1,4-benzoquinol methylase
MAPQQELLAGMRPPATTWQPNQAPRICKICGSNSLVIRKHTARCRSCGLLLYYPYPVEKELSSDLAHLSAKTSAAWYAKSAWHNHTNFTRMVRFATSGWKASRRVRFLDYGCGGGQFALVAKSHFPFSQVFCTDVSDDALLPEWRSLQTQIRFAEFPQNAIRFELIFLNNVLEHVADPITVLRLLKSKLEPNGKIFIDTPKSFWIYPATRLLSAALHGKLLDGTISLAHLQIWSSRAFKLAIFNAGLELYKYQEISEYTMPAEYYLDKMRINNRLVRFVGSAFYSHAKVLARNKIMALVSPQSVQPEN